jgi:hypothetical protein
MKNCKFFALILLLVISQSVVSSSVQQKNFIDENKNYEKLTGKFIRLKNKLMYENTSGDISAVKRDSELNAYPRIVVSANRIYFNGKELQLGESIEIWKRVIGGEVRCLGRNMALCVWDKWGLQVGADDTRNYAVEFLSLDLIMTEDDKMISQMIRTDRKTSEVRPSFIPEKVFPGYLELDGFEINATTEFQAVKRSNAERKFRCGLKNCSHPIGVFNEHATIYLTLNGSGEKSQLRRFSISKNTEY